MVTVRFRCPSEPSRFATPPEPLLSRVPCIGEHVYMMEFLDDVTWTVGDVVHLDFADARVHAEVTIERR